jgi:hypothetical protein
MIKVCVFKEFIVDNDDNTQYYQKWLNSELGKWVSERSTVETFFSFSHNTFCHELKYVAKFSEQDYCFLLLKFGDCLPK